MTERTTIGELAAAVGDGDTVYVGGTLFSRVPWALLQAVAARRPRDLHVVSWGGGFPLELLLEVDAVRALTFCFASLDIFGGGPRFREALEQDRLDVVELTALGLHQGLSAGKRRFPSEPMILPTGSDLVSGPGFPQRYADPVSSAPMGAVPAIRPDVMLLHATATDADGNLEISGALGLDLMAVPASTRVLATAEAEVPTSQLGTRRHARVVPRAFVHAVAVAPDGAAPFSCLPHRIADFAAIDRLRTAEQLEGTTPDWSAPTPPLESLTARQVVAAAPELGPESVDGPVTIDEHMIVRLARMLDDGDVCSVGAVSPLATAAYLLAKAIHAPTLTLITNGGGYVDVDERPLLFGLGEALDCSSAVTHMGGDESYEWYYQRGAVDYEAISVAQIDATGATNTSWVVSPSGRRIRLPGQGGMADVMEMHRHVVVYLPRQSPLNTPDAVSFTSSMRRLVEAADRERAGYRPGSVRLVTNLAVFELDPAVGRLRPVQRFPGVDDEQLRAATGFGLSADDLAATSEVSQPSDEELHVLRHRIDPLGLRRLEFVPSRERGALLTQLLAAETDLIARLTDAMAPA